MEAVVSDILRERMREPGGFGQTAVLSVMVHAVALLSIALVPVMWPARKTAPRVVMTISLGGTPGPKTGGISQIGGRNIVAAEPGAAPKLDRVALPTPKAEPAMVLPDPKLKPKTPPKTDAKSRDDSGRAGGRGAETEKGSSTVETGEKGMGFGLSNVGGGGTGGHLDVDNFCCPDYLTDMDDRIRQNWKQQQEAVGTVFMKFTILRNGQITQLETEKSSNFYALDAASQRALILTGKLAPLPSAFPDDHLTVHLSFEYKRK
ncbi:MAG TPA: TonB family protein [Vicinamibacterales bacterium]|jgi:TonB family protein|nr:TonB family protein [Vicinamibacterales bacterium]